MWLELFWRTKNAESMSTPSPAQLKAQDLLKALFTSGMCGKHAIAVSAFLLPCTTKCSGSVYLRNAREAIAESAVLLHNFRSHICGITE
jgi:hypothetical protein